MFAFLAWNLHSPTRKLCHSEKGPDFLGREALCEELNVNFSNNYNRMFSYNSVCVVPSFFSPFGCIFPCTISKINASTESVVIARV